MFRVLFAQVGGTLHYCGYSSARYHRPTTTSSRNLTTTFYGLYQWLHIQFLELLMMGAKSTRNI
jgi:hypothetical protein